MQALLGTDAVTAYRLSLDPSAQDLTRVPIARMLSTWNVIDPLTPKHNLEDLPDGMQREGEEIVSDQAYEPLRLSLEDGLAEVFRLSALRKSPDEDGWYNLSNLARVAKAIGLSQQLKEEPQSYTLTSYLHELPTFELRTIRDNLFVRPAYATAAESLTLVSVRAICPGDSQPRELEQQASFGAAYRALAQFPSALISHGTEVIFERGEESRRVSFDAIEHKWRHHTGELMKRCDSSDPVMHRYKHGHLVGALIGFVSQSKSGRIFANVGIPVDSPGDDDAFIHSQGRIEAQSHEEALKHLEARGDLDYIFTTARPYNHEMGFWLSTI